MLYKTTVLALLESHPRLHNHLRLSRRLLSEMERYAMDLRKAHHRMTDEGMESALELATAEIESRIASEDARLSSMT
jgi:hypothetical protein